MSRNSWTPNADMFVRDGGLVIKVELSGIQHKDLDLSVDGNLLIISGKRPDGCRVGKCSFYLMEINYGSFEREIQVPSEFDLSQAQAHYHNGFLRVDVPPAKSSKRSLSVSQR